MIIESVAAAAAILNQIGKLIESASEAQGGAQRVMSAILDFGQGLDDLEKNEREKFVNVSHSDLLKISMMRRQQERYEKDLEDMLIVVDPQLHTQYRQAKADQAAKRKRHMEMLAQQKKQRAELVQRIILITVIVITGLVAAGIVVGLAILMFKG